MDETFKLQSFSLKSNHRNVWRLFGMYSRLYSMEDMSDAAGNIFEDNIDLISDFKSFAAASMMADLSSSWLS